MFHGRNNENIFHKKTVFSHRKKNLLFLPCNMAVTGAKPLLLYIVEHITELISLPSEKLNDMKVLSCKNYYLFTLK